MRLRAAAACGLVVVLAAAGTALAASGATGNSHAIALARTEARAYTHVRVEKYKQTGFIDMNDQEGKTSFFYYNWGQTTLTPGWVWASEHATVVLKHGRIVWWRDDLTPPPCTGGGICHQIPVELLLDHNGAYYAFGSAAHHSCFGKLFGSLPQHVGALWDQVFGHYSAPASGPGVVKLTYTFPYGKGRTMRETDTISTHTHLAKSARLVITGGHTIRDSDAYPSTLPRTPTVNLCAG